MNRWFNDVPRGKTYRSGDIWGALGSWYAGAWWTEGAVWYINLVKRELAKQTWTTTDFKW